MAWLKCEYLLEHVGQEFDGVIAAVTSFGLFVELKDIYIEGLVHVTMLKKDYYHFEPAGQRLVGERTRETYRLGDSVRVKVIRVDLDDRKIDLELLSTTKKRRSATAQPATVTSPSKKPASKNQGSTKPSSKKAAPAASAEKSGKKSTVFASKLTGGAKNPTNSTAKPKQRNSRNRKK